MDKLISGLRSTSDGWRAVIADEFTFTNVRKIAYALGCYLEDRRENVGQDIRVLIAHDTRFMGNVFAKLVGNTLKTKGITCYLIDTPMPTPVLSWVTFNQKYNMGIMITASHNPPQYNGIKIRMPYGGSPEKKFMDAIEKLIPDTLPTPSGDNTDFHITDPRNHYFETIRKYVDMKAIDETAPVIAVDTMHGTTAKLLAEILSGTRAKVIYLNENPDPLFGGIAPEPKPSTIAPLLEFVRKHNCAFGVAHDGDGDRIVAVDPQRGYLSPHDLITLLAFDLADRRNLQGSIIASVSTTRRVQEVAKLIGMPYLEVPIGFRNAAQLMREQDVLIAGEENGGIGIGFHMPERDGTLIAALLTELVAVRKVGLGNFLADLEAKVGFVEFMRKDLKTLANPSEVINKYLLNLPKSVSGIQVSDLSETDGVKMILQDKSWVLVRAAGTEPLIRVYVESNDISTCKSIVEDVIAGLKKWDFREKVK